MALLLRWTPQIILILAIAALVLVANPTEDLLTVGAIYAGLLAFASMSRNICSHIG